MWRNRNTSVTLVPMRWSDRNESFEEKLARIKKVIDEEPTPAILVGESAGGAMVLSALGTFGHVVHSVITICGMNQGAQNVNPALYRKNVAFKSAMERADVAVAALDTAGKAKLSVVYSSLDFTVRPKDTTIQGVSSYDLRIVGHLPTIFSVLYWHHRKIMRMFVRSGSE